MRVTQKWVTTDKQRSGTDLFVVLLSCRRRGWKAIIRRPEISSACQIDWHARPVIQVPR